MKRFAVAAIIIISILVLSPPTKSSDSPKTDRQTEDFLPMAVWYGGGKVRAPMLDTEVKAHREAWRADLEKIKSLGFNSVKTWVDWATLESSEGRFNFENIDQLLDLAHQVGLKVYIQIYADSAPDWVGKKFPDSHFVDISGAVMPSEAAPGYCFDHPGVRKAMLGFFTALAERVKDQPAFMGWDLWSEPHIINWAWPTYLRSPEFCFCPYSVARYRDWLKRKYGTLEALNGAWYRHFTTWNEVEPNRLSTILSYTDFIDWRMFIVDKLAEDLRARYETVKSVIPDKIAVSHAANPSLITTPVGGDGNPDDWLMARQVDYWGTSFYPKHSSPVGRDPAWRGALLDFSRSACERQQNGFYIGELQAGFGTIALRVGATVTAADERQWMWNALARGAKGVNVYAFYPMSAGYESGGYGLIRLDGSLTDRARAAGAVARVVNDHQALLLKARALPAEVAIVYNPLAYMVGGRQPLPTPGAQSEFSGIERNSMLGIYRALMPSNVPVDFVHINEIAEGKAGRYKLIYLPYPLMLPQASGKGLVEFVRNGGTLMAEARLGWNDERGHAREIIPGFGLDEVTGCREEAVTESANGEVEIQIAARDESVPLLQPGDRLRGMIFEESLKPTSPHARVIARFKNGEPAIVASTFGKGKIILVGTFLGSQYESKRDAGLSKFFNGLMTWAGIHRPIEVTSSPESSTLEVRILESGVEKVVVVFNHAEEKVEADIAVEMPAGAYRTVDLETGQPISSQYESGALRFQRTFSPEQVWVIRVTPQ